MLFDLIFLLFDIRIIRLFITFSTFEYLKYPYHQIYSQLLMTFKVASFIEFIIHTYIEKTG